MSSSVKMYTLIDGSPSEIGQCHAGQARLLRKKGLAEWKDGKLWLLPPVATPSSTVNITIPPDAVPEDVIAVVAKSLKRGRYSDVGEQDRPVVRRIEFKPTPEYVEATYREAGIDTEGWEEGWSSQEPSVYPTYTEVPAMGVPGLIYEFRRRLGLGHETCSYDDPRERRVGFLDYTSNEYVYAPLTTIRERGVDQEEADALGIPLDKLKEMFYSAEGRGSIFGHGGFGKDGPSGDLEDIDWGTVPPDVSEVFNPTLSVGLLRVVAPVRLPPLKAEEDAQERIERVREERRAAYQFPLVPVPGWTYFTVAGSESVIPVLKDGVSHPEPSDVPVYGLYKRAQGRLFRVWAQGQGAGWDESILQEDCTYKLSVSHTLAGQPAHEHVEEALRLVDVRLEELSASKEAQHEVGPGWTKFFTFDDCPPVFFWDIPPDLSEEFNKHPYSNRPMTDEEKAAFVARLVRTPFTKLHGDKQVYGFYQVVGNRLFRVLASNGESSVWDESIRAPDGLYDLKGEGRSIDAFYNASGQCDLLAPSGFPETIKAAERRIAEYLASPDGVWGETRHDAVSYIYTPKG